MSADLRQPEVVNSLVAKRCEGRLTREEEAHLVFVVQDRVDWILSQLRVPQSEMFDREDLISIGVCAAFDRMDHWSEDKGDFLTFSYFRIHGSIIDYMRKMDPVPRAARAIIGSVRKESRRLEQANGEEPSVSQLSESTGIAAEDIRNAEYMANARTRYSLNMVMGDSEEGAELLVILPGDEDEDDCDDMLTPEMIAAIGKMPKRDQLILQDFYVRDIPQRDIALRYELTEARISQIRQKCIRQLSRAAGQG